MKDFFGYGRVSEFDMDEIKYVEQMPQSQNRRVIEPIACAMRGRNPDNPSERSRSNGKYQQRLEMGNNISNTITSVQKDALVAEPIIAQRPHGFNKGWTSAISPTITSSAFQDNNFIAEPQPTIIDDYNQRIPKDQDVIGTVTTQFGNSAPRHGYKIADLQQPPFRIRKLTPRECFRLMGVSETDIDKIQQSGVSQSQQYKMAGNSIVVDVLEHIFRKMFIDTGQESQQLSLF